MLSQPAVYLDVHATPRSTKILNKVAGVYGLIAVFTGGSFAQVSLYVYSVAALLAFAWGLRAVGEVRTFSFMQ